MRDVPEAMGPIQMLSIAFDGNHFKGEILPELERLKTEGIVRIIDLLVVRKGPLDDIMVMTASDLDWEEAVAFGSYFGAVAGFAAEGPSGVERGSIAGAAELADGHIFDEDDVFRVTQALPPNMTAALILLEHLWSKPLNDAVLRADGITLSNEWLSVEEVLGAARHAPAPRD
jgi:uncharacterized membrane protein